MVYDIYDDIFPDPYVDDLEDERRYDQAVRRHNKAQALEDRDTGIQLDPLPSFEEMFYKPYSEPDDE